MRGRMARSILLACGWPGLAVSTKAKVVLETLVAKKSFVADQKFNDGPAEDALQIRVFELHCTLKVSKKGCFN